MVKVNILADALRSIVNAERKGKKQVLLKPVSKVLIKFLRIMQKHNYIGEFEIIDDHRSKKIVVELIGRINKCGVISPNYDILVDDYEKWTNNILPSRQFGHLVISTTQGIFTHEESRERHIGGKIIGFFYWWLTLNTYSKNHRFLTLPFFKGTQQKVSKEMKSFYWKSLPDVAIEFEFEGTFCLGWGHMGIGN